MANSSNRYKEIFPSFPGEYRRNGQDSIKFLPYDKLQKTCRAIDKGNKDPNKTYTACTKQYFLNCNSQDDSRPPSVSYFLKNIDKNPDFFENIRSHEDAHQQAIYAHDLVRCYGGNPDLAKKIQEDIKELVFQMDNQEYVKCDDYGNCSFTRSFDMQQKLEELLDRYSEAILQENLKKKTEEFFKNFPESKF